MELRRWEMRETDSVEEGVPVIMKAPLVANREVNGIWGWIEELVDVRSENLYRSNFVWELR